ncbi:HesA/MoeB/ThiF family protein [Oceanibaculum indicum]|uniref:Molybdopterin-synthase adenylyltransferase n=1 Tax=Oceanibaculum indicum P24 TaxID=1207063 RepID=K2KLN2_9PROT|nr:molybdopterin-synthase adenylyltransferase MoeB [Oceanibaculum indicum]EKE78345.1 molybdopterin biosynthesis protein [Oceanibaculum indicum P24]
MELNDEQFHRYARHLILDEVGEEGQEKLLGARVLVIGAGGLGAPLLMYLAAAGVGTLGVVDYDEVELSNLQRQIIHGTADLGRLKVDSAIDTVRALNPGIDIIAHREKLTQDNVAALVAGYDIVADGSDNFDCRYLLNDACYFARKTLVSGALLRFEGQISVFKAHEAGCPCYRCLFPEKPPADLIPRCSQAGILGAVAGVIGTLQATEILKEILGLGDSLAGRLMLYDALSSRFQTVKIPKDPDCPLCGTAPSITEIRQVA